MSFIELLRKAKAESLGQGNTPLASAAEERYRGSSDLGEQNPGRLRDRLTHGGSGSSACRERPAMMAWRGSARRMYSTS